jgi:hypothetical protein
MFQLQAGQEKKRVIIAPDIPLSQTHCILYKNKNQDE